MSFLDDEPRPPSRPATGSTRTPPHNLQAEESLLGAMLLSKDAIAVASEVLDAENFYKPAHGHIFEAITSLSAAGEPADPVTVAEELRRAGLLDAVGGPAALVTLQASTPAISNASRYARIVEEHALLRRLIGVAGEIAEMSYDLPEDVTKTVDQAESLVFEVAQRRVTDTMAPIHDLLNDNLDRLESLYDKGDAITGTATGFLDLDELLSGLQPNALYVLGARPSMGKTALALGIASHAAIEAQRPTLIFSLEMGQLELTQRMLCSEARVDSKRVRNGNLSEADWGKIAHATGRLAEAPMWIDDNPNLTIMEIRSKARRLKSRLGDLGLVVVDYLQLMTGRSSAENRQVEVSEISRGLKILARELECPVLALSQLSRQLEMRADKRPMLADLRESGSIEQDADVVMFIYRDDVYNPDSPDRGTAEILVSKHRNGPTGMVRLAFLDHNPMYATLAGAAGPAPPPRAPRRACASAELHELEREAAGADLGQGHGPAVHGRAGQGSAHGEAGGGGLLGGGRGVAVDHGQQAQARRHRRPQVRGDLDQVEPAGALTDERGAHGSVEAGPPEEALGDVGGHVVGPDRGEVGHVPAEADRLVDVVGEHHRVRERLRHRDPLGSRATHRATPGAARARRTMVPRDHRPGRRQGGAAASCDRSSRGTSPPSPAPPSTQGLYRIQRCAPPMIVTTVTSCRGNRDRLGEAGRGGGGRGGPARAAGPRGRTPPRRR